MEIYSMKITVNGHTTWKRNLPQAGIDYWKQEIRNRAPRGSVIVFNVKEV